jgi:DNA-binding transcriptional ArsR family regulator
MHKEIFQAMADPTKLAIIALIALHALTLNVMDENFNTNQQAVSKDLRILTDAELVNQEQKVREIYSYFEIDKQKEIDN